VWRIILLPLLTAVLCLGAMQAASSQSASDTAPALGTAAPDADERPAMVLQPVATPDGVGEFNYDCTYLLSGARHFYRVFGRWPLSWREVCDCGLFQARLVLPGGSEIDPDDPAPPAVPGEVRFRPAADAGSTPTVLSCYASTAGQPGAPAAEGVVEVHSTSLERGNTYADMFQAKAAIQNEEVLAAMNKQIAYLTGDPKRLLQLGLGDMILDGLMLYRMVHGDYPRTWQEFITSGISPVGADSINPLTGQVLRCDGSIGDYFYQYIPPASDHPSIGDFRCVWPPEGDCMFSVWP
jgi:hypothetical protein